MTETKIKVGTKLHVNWGKNDKSNRVDYVIREIREWADMRGNRHTTFDYDFAINDRGFLCHGTRADCSNDDELLSEIKKGSLRVVE